MSALTLKKFHVNSQATGQEEAVHVIGRQGGILAFLLSLMKIDPVTELKCNDERVEVTQSSFFGRQTIFIPHGAVTGIVGGFKKPKSLFLTMIFVLFFGATASVELGAGVLLGALVISLILFIYYILKKEMALHVQNGGDTLWGLSFKRSVIENVAIDINKVNETIRVINWKVMNAQR